MDDLLVWGSNEEEYDRRLAEVQKRVLQYGLLLNHDKCVMKQNTISFLGEILSAEGIRPSDDIISVINNMMKPQNREEVQRLLGLVNYVGKYIANLSNRTKYIRTLLCKKY